MNGTQIADQVTDDQDSVIIRVVGAAVINGAGHVSVWRSGRYAVVTVFKGQERRTIEEAARLFKLMWDGEAIVSTAAETVTGDIVLSSGHEVRVMVYAGSYVDHLAEPSESPAAAIPAQRSGEVEVLDRDDLAHDADDEIRDSRLDMLLDGVEL